MLKIRLVQPNASAILYGTCDSISARPARTLISLALAESQAWYDDNCHLQDEKMVLHMPSHVFPSPDLKQCWIRSLGGFHNRKPSFTQSKERKVQRGTALTHARAATLPARGAPALQVPGAAKGAASRGAVRGAAPRAGSSLRDAALPPPPPPPRGDAQGRAVSSRGPAPCPTAGTGRGGEEGSERPPTAAPYLRWGEEGSAALSVLPAIGPKAGWSGVAVLARWRWCEALARCRCP